MFCEHCGNRIEDDAIFCSGCGKKVAHNPTEGQKASSGNGNVGMPFASSEPAPTTQGSPFMNAEPAPTTQGSPFMNAEPAPTTQGSLFMNAEPTPTTQGSPFMNIESTPQSPFAATGVKPTEQNSPFSNSTSASQVKQAPFMDSSAVTGGSPFGAQKNAGAGNVENPFVPESAHHTGDYVDQQTENAAGKKGKKEKKQEQKEKKKKDNQNEKIILMVLAQIVFIAIICFLGFTGKLNNSLGEINLGFTIGLLVVIMAINVLLYMLLFSRKDKVVLAPPPVDQNYTSRKSNVPTYMSEITGATGGIGGGYAAEEAEDDCPTEVSTPVAYDDDDEATVVIEEAPPPPKYAKLEYVENGIAHEILITKNEFIIGRLRGRVDFIATNKKIGRIHAAIITRDNCYYVKDFNSQNRTYINRGGAITPEQEYQIYDNDTISFADSEFVFKLPE